MSELQESQEQLESCRSSYRILLIEDDPLASSAISTLLNKRGHSVTASPRGDDALELFQLLKPQVVILDMILPDVDIFEVLNDFRRSEPQPRILAISGNPFLLTVAERHGVAYTLRKPFSGDELEALLPSRAL